MMAVSPCWTSGCYHHKEKEKEEEEEEEEEEGEEGEEEFRTFLSQRRTRHGRMCWLFRLLFLLLLLFRPY